MAEDHHGSIKVLEICTISPPPGSAVPASLPLTFFDILWFRFPPVERLFFYKSPAAFHAILLNLKNSLSRVLQHYLPLAGAIVWPETSPKPAVVTTAGDGVVLTVAESDADFDHLVSDGLREEAKLRPLVAELAVEEERAAVMAVQVTSFGKGGFSIGITAHHAILDGRSSTSFVKSWAGLCKNLVAGGEPVSPAAETMPFYDRSVVADPAGLEAIYLKSWLAMGGPNNRSLKCFDVTIPPDLFRGTFKLNLQNIQKLKQFVLRHRTPTHPPLHVSTFTVTMAYTWVCTSVADGSPPDGERAFGMSVDARGRLDPPLPVTYFGNCVVVRGIALERAKLVGQKGVVAAVEVISDMIKSLEEEGPLNGAENWVSLIAEGAKNNWKPISTAGSPKFEVYSVDFGWGTPEKVEVVSIDATGAVCISESRDGGGVEIGWTAKRDVMENFAAVFAKGLQEL
ncbi:malonyl-CoA:anthocyanidin 5-O-glucoside-6''-O-malonyltransferase-like [Benincasa hispida]|uniref:malonyl-CoA:anthocyanidin 5-O-glucoside-6''-O-malonyltransferase-like n=1 Tax=Benincasa hispida TaxID=102211 RepID=UPI001901C243|nr:malonyl-CoA:anthocyanidin 5-O-glucoside-6''-O-malonyltransferase-like [Benincasa hispida]XP_038875311.1 malonyl-CoA:anthocyanidin 5-O-glucoside-6''-O-malonyltransferase-like [Benincasa hispida]XP_038878095.1 malonyl-CoA:anthocyanidin 5-O-glucoside-6''-O-malonyltransferase-like [Benincasa hispida]